MNKSVSVVAPAKINMGLEVLFKRDDGFHEVRSVMHGLDLHDALRFDVALERQQHVNPMPDVPFEGNLVNQAMRLFQRTSGQNEHHSWQIEKRIPAAAGLGGGSSDAAATLLALNMMADHPLDPSRLLALAAALGSDVPFFLKTLFACIGGRGGAVEPVNDVTLTWEVVLICPKVTLKDKTRRLYGALDSSDWTDGEQTEALLRCLRTGSVPDRALLGNAFSGPLYEIVPGLRRIPELLQRLGMPLHGLTGAGPSHYVLLPAGSSSTVIRSLEPHLGDTCRLVGTMLRSAPIIPSRET